MTEYIDRVKLIADMKKRYCEPCMANKKDYNGVRCRACWVGDATGEVNDAQEEDVAPVRHGRWKVYETETYLGSTESGKDRYVTNKIFYCDQCGKGTVIKSRFCAHCGAKMDGGQDGCI